MSIVYAREYYDDFIDELKAVLPTHWKEMALNQDDIPLDPDYEFYRRAFSVDMARMYTVRDDGKLVGYVLFFVTPRHPHYKHMWIKDDTIWLHPAYRNSSVGNGLFDFFEADLSEVGPVVIQIETRIGHPALDHLVTSRGYYPNGALYGKRFA